MYKNQIYEIGIYGVLKVHWQLRCETPLAVRNGLGIGYEDRDQKKSRGMGLRFKWQAPTREAEHEVTALHYGYEVKNNRLVAYHFIPPSSIRGTFRSWTINHLIHPDYRSGMTPPEKSEKAKTQEYLANIKKAITEEISGYQWIASLFGQAFETRDEDVSLSNAGRLHIETTRFDHAQAQLIAVNGILEDGMAGPENAYRQMTVRNPLDRVTHASKEKGLHHFLEFCKGEIFEVHMTILNPQGSDLGMLCLWQREIETGLLRFGALSSIGRGRVSILDQKYQLWLGPGAPAFDWMTNWEMDNTVTTDDVLSDLWNKYTLRSASLDNFISCLQEQV